MKLKAKKIKIYNILLISCSFKLILSFQKYFLPQFITKLRKMQV